MSNRSGSRRLLRKARVIGLVVAAFAALTAAAPSASAETINTAGPLNQIIVSEDLACQLVNGEIQQFDSGDEEDDYCGTFVGLDGNVYGNTEAGPSAFQYVFEDNNQTLSGSGTPADPYKLTTVVHVVEPEVLDAVGGSDAAPAQVEGSLLTITETETYVDGDDFYRTDVEVHNDTTDTLDPTLYHAGDCQLRGDDVGYAVEDSEGAGPVFCTPQQFDEQVAAIEFQGDDHALLGFVPVGDDSDFREALAATLFGEVDGNPFSDECENCVLDPFDSDPVDNGVGLSWVLDLPAGATARVCFLTVDSYEGNVPQVPSGCTPAAAGTTPATVAQQPSACKLRISRARVFLFRNHPRLRLVARYRSAEPADVEIDYVAVEGGNKVKLGEVTRHFNRHGLFRLRKELSEQQADELWTTDRFIVHFKIPGEPGFCSRQYTKKLTVPRIVEGQRVVFQEDSQFGPGSPGHPGN